MPKISLNLPASFYGEEVRNDYKISADMKKVWAVELDLFKQLDQICKKHNITYYADGGTLLGAIRHHGFIPWDDDMDFIMLRSDFEKLCKVSSEFKEPYFFQTEETDPGSLRCHAQLRNSETTGILNSDLSKKYPFNQGIFIDIFLLDGVPEDAKERSSFVKSLQKNKWKAREYYDYNHNFIPNIKVDNIYTLLKKGWHFT
ncbi:LicD family protein, partial [Lactobacillus helveticus]